MRLLRISMLLPLLAITLFFSSAWAEEVAVENGVFIYDTDGNPIHAHGGAIIQVGDYYYLYGENRYEDDDKTFKSVNMYRSTDLKNWEFRNAVLRDTSDAELNWAKIERPKIIYNAVTDEYIMWMHKEEGDNYSQARAAVAVSDTIDGDYQYLGSFRPLGNMSRDCTAYVDDDGTAYFISAANHNADTHIYKLTPDYRSIDSLVQKVWVGEHREAHTIIKRNGYYFMVTSGTSGWDPNQAEYGYATSIDGAWSSTRNVGDSITYDSQPTYLLEVSGTEDTSYMYMGDRWKDPEYADSKYIWLPIDFPTDTSMEFSWSSTIYIDTAKGLVSQFSANNPNLALDKTVNYSSEQSGNEASDLVDGNEDTRWAAQTFPEWVDVDLGSTMTINQTQVVPYNERAYQYRVEVSTDGITYTEVVDRTSNTTGGSLLVDNFMPVSARYVRITVTGASGYTGDWISLREFRIFNDPNAEGIVAGQTYMIKSRNSNKCLSTRNGSTSAGTQLVQDSCSTGSTLQQWQVNDAGNNEFQLVQIASSLYADISGSSTQDGGDAILWSDNGGANQRWRIVAEDNGYYLIENVNSGKVLDVANASLEDGADIIQWTINGGFNQDWTFEPVQ